LASDRLSAAVSPGRCSQRDVDAVCSVICSAHIPGGVPVNILSGVRRSNLQWISF
jgi:hypothetical protein